MEPELVQAYQATPLRLGQGATGRAAATGEPVEIADLFQVQELARLRRFAAEQQEVTWCGVRFGVKGARRSGSRKPSRHWCLVPVH
jgi:hypothetical protein